MAFKKTYPIVLAHGIARFDVISNDVLDLDNTEDVQLDQLHYFKGIRTLLEKNNYKTRHAAGVAWADSADDRGAQLKKAVLQTLKETGAEKVNIIAHSMGGIDTRHMMFNDRNKGKIHTKVASLTTISTPHEGSAVADFFASSKGTFEHLFKAVGIDIDGLDDITMKECAKFNEKSKAFEAELLAGEFKLQTYAGQAEVWNVFGPLRIPYAMLLKKQGPNDGLVAVEAAKYRGRPHQAVIANADHLNELGWWDISSFLVETPKKLLARIHQLFLSIAKDLPQA